MSTPEELRARFEAFRKERGFEPPPKEEDEGWIHELAPEQQRKILQERFKEFMAKKALAKLSGNDLEKDYENEMD